MGAGVFVQVENGPRGKQVNVSQLRGAIQRVLNDPTFAESARRIKDILRSYGGASQAAQSILQFSRHT
jgi:UDP:flavonoid glycosyltransferase YjiC (YdhE family)